MQYLDDCAGPRICLINQIRWGDGRRLGRYTGKLDGDRYSQRKAIVHTPEADAAITRFQGDGAMRRRAANQATPTVERGAWVWWARPVSLGGDCGVTAPSSVYHVHRLLYGRSINLRWWVLMGGITVTQYKLLWRWWSLARRETRRDLSHLYSCQQGLIWDKIRRLYEAKTSIHASAFPHVIMRPSSRHVGLSACGGHLGMTESPSRPSAEAPDVQYNVRLFSRLSKQVQERCVGVLCGNFCRREINFASVQNARKRNQFSCLVHGL